MAFSVDVAALQGASGDVARNAADIEASVATLVGRLNGLHGTWTGTAATEFEGVFSEWQSIQTRVREQLAILGQLMARASSTYQSTEDSVRGLFAR